MSFQWFSIGILSKVHQECKYLNVVILFMAYSNRRGGGQTDLVRECATMDPFD